MNLAPIVLFVYNRPEHTLMTIDALSNNEYANESNLFIFSDGPKQNVDNETFERIQKVRSIIHHTSGFKSIEIYEEPSNKGLDSSEIDAVTEIINRFGEIIVLEDDVVTHRFFLRFMNEALDYYQTENRVWQIGGNTPPIPYVRSLKTDVFASYRSESWGWATWANRWNQCDWSFRDFEVIKNTNFKNLWHCTRGGSDLYSNLCYYAEGYNDAWDARWQDCMNVHNGYCIRPTRSLIQNVGLDGSGEHCPNMSQEGKNFYLSPLYNQEVYSIKLKKFWTVNPILTVNMRDYYASGNGLSGKKQIKRAVKRILKRVCMIR